MQINKEFLGLEVGAIQRDIVKAHDGQWTYSDKKMQLKVGDIVYYWIHIVHNNEFYNLVDQKFPVTGFWRFFFLFQVLYDSVFL